MMALLHSLVLISERLWRASTWFWFGGKECESSAGAGEGWELLCSSCTKAQRSQFLQLLRFEWLPLLHSTLHKKLVSGHLSTGDPSGFVVFKMSFSSSDEQGHRERPHLVTHAEGHEKQFNTSPEWAPSTTVLQWDPLLCVIVLLWEHHTELPSDTCFALCCLIYSQDLPTPVPTSERGRYNNTLCYCWSMGGLL